MGVVRLTRIVSAIGIAVAGALWNVGYAAARADFDLLAMFTGIYISHSRACDVDDWQAVFRETIEIVQRSQPREPKDELKYTELVVQWATQHETSTCDRKKLTRSIEGLRDYRDTAFPMNPGECKPPHPRWSLVYCR